MVNRKRVQRLMRWLGLTGMAPGPNTNQPHLEHKMKALMQNPDEMNQWFELKRREFESLPDE